MAFKVSPYYLSNLIPEGVGNIGSTGPTGPSGIQLQMDFLSIQLEV